MGSEVILGRSPDCQVTIEDPLVSRQHALIRVDGGGVTVRDLGSRNGVRINGRRIQGEQTLGDGDRIRLGTQELIFFVVEPTRRREPRPTGFLRACGKCGTPYPEVASECPHCGAKESPEEDTISGLSVEPPREWALELLAEVIGRALAADRASEAERLLRRATREIDERSQGGTPVAGQHLADLCCHAIALSQARGTAEWLSWVLGLHKTRREMLPAPALEAVEALDLDAIGGARDVLRAFVTWWRESCPDQPSDDLASLARLERVVD